MEGKPVLLIDIGAALMAVRYDERGNAVEVAFFGVYGSPLAI